MSPGFASSASSNASLAASPASQTNVSTVVVVLDVSGGMRAGDIAPSRLAAEGEATWNFLAHLPPSIRTGLVTFSRSAVVVQKPTLDRSVFYGELSQLQPESASAPGSGLETGLSVALTSLRQQGIRSGAGRSLPALLVLVSFGLQNHGPTLDEAAHRAEAAGIRVDAITIGTATGKVLFGSGKQTIAVPVPALPGAMAQVSLTTGGQAFDATNAKRLTAISTELAAAIAAPPSAASAAANAFKEASARDDRATSLRIDMTDSVQVAGRTVAFSANGIELPRRHVATIQVNVSRINPQLGVFQEVGFGHYVYMRVPDYPTLERRYPHLKPWVSARVPGAEISPSSGTASSFTGLFGVVPVGHTTDAGVAVERYSAELDLSGALSVNPQFQALLQQSSALRSLFEKPIKVSFDVGDDGYLRRERLAFDFSIGGVSLKEEIAISFSGFDTPVRPVRPPPRGQIMTNQQFQAEVSGAVTLPVVM